jgi:SanA protein
MKFKPNIQGIKWKRILVYLTLFSFLLLSWSNFSVYYESKNFISNDLNDLPNVKTGLLLGTSRTIGRGRRNDYFFNRIDACLALFQSGKITTLLISGDNSSVGYNEPQDMKNELIARGVPAEKIYLDYAGFDTYDSVIRAWKIFGQKKFIVISQHFHNQRAVYIARRFGIDAYGFDAKDVKKMNGLKTKFRELFACVKAYVEVKFSVDPTMLGEEIIIP